MTITSGESWRIARTTEITFPSGNTAVCRTVGTDLFIKLGRVPDWATSYVLDAIEQTGGVFDIRKLPERKTLEDEKNWIDFINAVTETCFVNPKIVDNPQADDEISVDDVEYGDKVYLAAFLGRPIQSLATFLKEQADRVAAVSAKSTDTSTTVENPKD